MTSELRPAVEVWDSLWDAFTGTPPQSGNPNAPFEAAAAVIEADREAVRAEQAAELAKYKALAEELAETVKEASFWSGYDDKGVPAVWLTKAEKVLRKYKEARDAS